MSVVPKNQQFFYLIMVSALVIMATMIVITATALQHPQLSTSQAAPQEQSAEETNMSPEVHEEMNTY